MKTLYKDERLSRTELPLVTFVFPSLDPTTVFQGLPISEGSSQTVDNFIRPSLDPHAGEEAFPPRALDPTEGLGGDGGVGG